MAKTPPKPTTKPGHKISAKNRWRANQRIRKQETDGLQEVSDHQPPPRKINISLLLKMLVRISAPVILLQLVLLIGSRPTSLIHDRDIDGHEFYAGKHEVTQAQWRIGMTSYPMDIVFDEELDDINSNLGVTRVSVIILSIPYMSFYRCPHFLCMLIVLHWSIGLTSQISSHDSSC